MTTHIDAENDPSRPAGKGLVERLDPASLAQDIVSVLRDSIPAYQRLPEQVVFGSIRETSEYSLELFRTVLREGRRPTPAEMLSLQRSAEDRATEGATLEDVLHAYMVGCRVAWEALRRAAVRGEEAALNDLAVSVIDYMDDVSTAVAQAYLAEREYLVSEAERRLRHLLEALCDEGPVSGTLLDLMNELGLEERDLYFPFAVAVRDAPPRAHAQRAERLREAGALAVTEGTRVAGLAMEDRAGLLEAEEGEVLACGAATERRRLAEALDEARSAADVAAALGLRGKVSVTALLPDLLLAKSPDLAGTLVEEVLGPLEDQDRRRSGSELVRTVQTYLATGLDRAAAAHRLHIHPNTLDGRLRRARELSGQDLREVEDITRMALALRQRALSGAAGGSPGPHQASERSVPRDATARRR